LSNILIENWVEELDKIYLQYAKIYKNDLVNHQYIDVACLNKFDNFNGRYDKDEGK